MAVGMLKMGVRYLMMTWMMTLLCLLRHGIRRKELDQREGGLGRKRVTICLQILVESPATSEACS